MYLLRSKVVTLIYSPRTKQKPCQCDYLLGYQHLAENAVWRPHSRGALKIVLAPFWHPHLLLKLSVIAAGHLIEAQVSNRYE
jgi:hypothetical protein